MNEIATMSAKAVSAVRSLENEALKLPQVPIETIHALHANVYARTVRIPAGVMITGALIKIPTVLIVSGHAIMYAIDGAEHVSGYNVFSAAAARKSAFFAMTDTYLTMLFATNAQTVVEAEAEFTDETSLLVTRES
jgi:hypothetical protein